MNKEIYETLITPYVRDMDNNIPWNEYPRPSMVRGSFLCLNGWWDFQISDEKLPNVFEEKILVPFPPESALSNINQEIPKNKFLHYRRIFNLPNDFWVDKILLHFGAVDTICDVFVNGSNVLRHEGGYLPFYADITDFVKEGDNELYVKVQDNLSHIFPWGKQSKKRGGMWYTPVSGIWQTVWIESVPNNYIERLHISTGLDEVKIKVIGCEGLEKQVTLSNGKTFTSSSDEITISPLDKHLWTPEDPYLYNFTLTAGKDSVEGYFALREVGIIDDNGIKKLALNRKSYLFNGLLDQGYFPDGIFLPATKKGFEDDILRAKSMGYNMLRKHIKVEPEIFYNLCDKLGIAVFQDIINNSNYSFVFDTALPTLGMKRFPDKFLHINKKSRRIFEEHMNAQMEHLNNFPSVVYYTIFNEGWGQFCADKMYKKAKEKDNSRIIDATSGWFVQKLSDVDSHHVYFKPLKLKKFGKRPVVISEFGGYSHRVSGHLFGKANYGYRLYKTAKEYEDAVFSLYKKEVATLAKAGVSAFVYTQLTDVEDETNGLITYDRCIVKIPCERMAKLMKELY